MTRIQEVLYTDAKDEYKYRLREFNEFRTGIGAVMSLINATTGSTAKPFIRDMSEGPNNLKEAMQELKTRFAMTDRDWKRQLQLQVQKMYQVLSH
jgi:hypothetical protein